ncbi:MAG TPA: lipocalin family protein [bacterium]|nr:lipocalin family protein [bacterium]
MLILLSASTIAAEDDRPPQVVKQVDLQRYLGVWYEIARYPNRFERDCVAATAAYSLRDDGKIDVLNQCRRKTLDGKPKAAKGKAWIVDPVTNAKLKVSFFWPFSGDYWIIDLDEEYRYAVVGHPERKYLWILSRTPQMDEETYANILERLRAQGYDPAKLIRVPQVGEQSQL